MASTVAHIVFDARRFLGGQEEDVVINDEEMGPLNLPHQPKPAAVVQEQPRLPSIVADPCVSDAELTVNPSKGFNYENTSGEPKKWDIFLSYRASADHDLVRDLYWQLCHLTVVASGH